MKLRSLRRHHKERMKIKSLNINPWDLHAKNADNLAKCSCQNCGNPRHWFDKITIAEYLAYVDFVEQIKELDLNHEHWLPSNRKARYRSW